MNQLSTIASIIAKMDHMDKQATKGAELDNILETVKSVVKAEPDIDLTAAWAENNLTYLDFRFAIAPRWAIEGHEVNYPHPKGCELLVLPSQVVLALW